ncbi:hypothetical protein N6B72_04965 [Chryseobacterium soli]|uniref:hypothetical protein n=1 Tax=Chryseobacterium soli TaxID=445961 RepID=UPI002953B289|nr:hypothetical protein [Chryseobacterium soli]MDV7696268.1 hypothetical protein [Chryseobacterium soli]
MKKLTIKLSNGQEVELIAEDVKILKHIIDQAFANLDDSEYERIKKLKPSDIPSELELLSDGDLFLIAKQNDEHIEEKEYNRDSFTIKIRQELFKRRGIGFIQIKHLSRIQRNYLDSLGLKNR